MLQGTISIITDTPAAFSLIILGDPDMRTWHLRLVNLVKAYATNAKQTSLDRNFVFCKLLYIYITPRLPLCIICISLKDDSI